MATNRDQFIVSEAAAGIAAILWGNVRRKLSNTAANNRKFCWMGALALPPELNFNSVQALVLNLSD